MNNAHCKMDFSLSDEEKKVFAGHLNLRDMAANIWDLFDEWVARSTKQVRFFYLKVYEGQELIGLGLFIKIKPVDLRTSYLGLRQNPFLSKLARGLSLATNNCLYISFRNLITSNLDRPFFFQEPDHEETVMAAILKFLKKEKPADMVSIIDTTQNDALYKEEGFHPFPCPSEAFFDATQYEDISQYLAKHKSLRKNLKRRKNQVSTEIKPGPLSGLEKEQMRACVECSAGLSRVNNPCQQFFEDHILQTHVFDSRDYIHILIRVEGRIVGFHTFVICGSHLGGVLGGFNRKYSQKSFAYERVIVGSLDYAIKHGLQQVHYSLIDNFTKLRLVESRQPCGLYFFSKNPMNRMVFQHTYKFNDIHELSLLETGG